MFQPQPADLVFRPLVRLGGLAAGLGLLVSALTGCSPTESAECPIFWQVYETTDETVTDAEAVVVGTIVTESGERSVNGVDTPVWTVSTEEWLKGKGAAEIEVASISQGCDGETAEDVDMSDPLSDYEGSTVALFLTSDEGEWQTLSPFQGVISLDSGEELPSAWPARFEE